MEHENEMEKNIESYQKCGGGGGKNGREFFKQLASRPTYSHDRNTFENICNLLHIHTYRETIVCPPRGKRKKILLLNSIHYTNFQCLSISSVHFPVVVEAGRVGVAAKSSIPFYLISRSKISNRFAGCSREKVIENDIDVVYRRIALVAAYLCQYSVYTRIYLIYSFPLQRIVFLERQIGFSGRGYARRHAQRYNCWY